MTPDWVAELGLDGAGPPFFFRSSEETVMRSAIVSQAHEIRRAFSHIGVEGVVCIDGTPMVYIKSFAAPDREAIREFHRRSWNHGIAPVLVVVLPGEFKFYSAVSEPARTASEVDLGARLVKVLSRTALALEVRQQLVQIASGEFFRERLPSFDPRQRLDRRLLQNLSLARSRLLATGSRRLSSEQADALLCRVIFASYLLDRTIVTRDVAREFGANDGRLASLLSAEPRTAKSRLYRLFRHLKHEVGGDLFALDLDDEERSLSDSQIEIIRRMLAGDDLASGQLSLGFWAYDFGVIPIETLSAVYERFLRLSDPERQQETGAFYTPRNIADLSVELALEGVSPKQLVASRFLDPACGSGVFLVSIFHRLVEAWNLLHPQSTYRARVEAFLGFLRNSLVGVDLNESACRIAAFGLHLAFLDHLSPPDIRRLKEIGRTLPELVSKPRSRLQTLVHSDFEALAESEKFDFIVGNPPWVSRTGSADSPMLQWSAERQFPAPQGQIAYSFVWKSTRHLRPRGRCLLLLPFGMLFNHDRRALEFQEEWLSEFPPDLILNLADLRYHLFEGAIRPTVVIRFSKSRNRRYVRYLVPKATPEALASDMIRLSPADESRVDLQPVRELLEAGVAPSVWKQRMWGGPRDWKFIDRIQQLPRLARMVDDSSESKARWSIGQGFQPAGDNDTQNLKARPWPDSALFIEGKSSSIHLILLERDCAPLRKRFQSLRRLPEARQIFSGPHVLVTKGLKSAFADFDVTFRHAVQGISGPEEDRHLLMFLAAVLDSDLAKYFLFHTSASWGVERPEVHLSELLQLPFPNAGETPGARAALQEVAKLMTKLGSELRHAGTDFGRTEKLDAFRRRIRPHVLACYDVSEEESALIDATVNIAMPSATPQSFARLTPAGAAASDGEREQFLTTLTQALNFWMEGGRFRVEGKLLPERAGLAGLVLGLVQNAKIRVDTDQVAEILGRISKGASSTQGLLQFRSGVKIFDRSLLVMLKPRSIRFWSRAAALNDADEIGAYILSSDQQ